MIKKIISNQYSVFSFLILVTCYLLPLTAHAQQPERLKPNYIEMRLVTTPQPVSTKGVLWYDIVDSLLKIRNPDGSIDTFCVNCSGGGTTVNVVFGIQFVTVNSQLIYTAADVGFNLTGKNLREVHVAGSECYQQGNVSINGSGGVTFNFNPGVNFCFIEYQ